MRRKTKGLGLVLVAVLALGAIGAQGAAGHEFSTAYHTTVISGPNEPGSVYTLTTNTGAAVGCNKSSLRGVQLATTEADTWTLVPSYSECTFAGNAATIKVVDCAYIFESDTVGEHADVDLECSEGGQIEIVTSACTLDIRAQTAIEKGARYFNETAPETVTLQTTATNIKVAQKTGSAILCAFAGTTATATGNFTLDGDQLVSLTNGLTTPNIVIGNGVGIEVTGAPDA